MNKWLLLSFSVLLFCTVGQGLVCKVCKFKVGKLCWFSGEPCQVNQNEFCETTGVYVGPYRMFTKTGCGKYWELCNKQEDRDNAFRVNYRRSCCQTDLCND